MKLTSEQQAFYEYGRAKLALQLRIDSIREYTIIAWRKYYDDMSKSERRIICDQHALGLLVERLPGRPQKAAIIRERHYRIVKDASNKINRWTSLDFRNIWRVEDELELYPSLSEAKEELSSWQYERR